MSQQELLKFLKSKRKNKKWYTVKEIKKEIGGNISQNCRRLRNIGMIRHKEDKAKYRRPRILYKWKR